MIFGIMYLIRVLRLARLSGILLNKAIREFWAPNYKRQWNSAVYDQVEAINSQFKVPLPVSEVKAIANSPV